MSEYILFDTGKNSVRLIHRETGRQFGEDFQESCRAPEWRAAFIVYDKYRRKMDLEIQDLRRLTEFVMKFSQERKDAGKNVSNDYLVQIASNEIKTYKKETEKTWNCPYCFKDIVMGDKHYCHG